MRAAVVNVGCRLNQSEGDSLRGYLADQGYSLENVKCQMSNAKSIPQCQMPNDSGPLASHPPALHRLQSSIFNLQSPIPHGLSLVIVNTCCVTKEAERSSISRIRQVARLSPKPELIVTGCMAEHDPARLRKIPGVDRVLGIAEKARLIANAPVVPDRSRAFLKVQDGCGNHCPYCVASVLRPEPKSKSPDQVQRETRALLDQGFQEIVLVGLNLGRYGHDSGSSLAELISKLKARNSKLGTPRPWLLRLSSLEPDTVTEELLAVIAGMCRALERNAGKMQERCRKDAGRMQEMQEMQLLQAQRSCNSCKRSDPATPILCPHFHIPLQSGDDGVLRVMRRHYTAGGYRRLIERIAARIPDACLGSDVIVGFPGEDDAAFENTRRLIETSPLSYLHVFSYSPRPGTQAFALGDPVPRHVKRARVATLRQLGDEKFRAYRRRFIGQVRPGIIVESSLPRRPCAMPRVLTDNYLQVPLDTRSARSGALVAVRITEGSIKSEL